MVSFDDIRQIAESLPDTVVGVNDSGQLYVDAAGKGIAWSWMERVTPKQPRVPRPDVLAVRVASGEEKESLIAADPKKFFTEPHYNGFPAVLVRLSEVDLEEMRELLIDAWRTKAPKKLIKESGQ